MHYLILEEVDSTNSYVSRHASELSDFTFVTAHRQTAGRGQRGNSWEAEEGKNLTFTLYHRPAGIAARNQFAVSEATALAVVEYLAEEGIEAKVKWPNDIYVGNRKIAGILIEHSILGRDIEHSRIGVGLNVNQTEFRSDAPNPVSMVQISGEERDLNRASAQLGVILERRLLYAATPAGREALHEEFLSKLWRGDGKAYPFRERESGREFSGRILTVASDGHLHLADGPATRIYAFKEVEFLIKD